MARAGCSTACQTLLASDPDEKAVYVVEGEKDVDTLVARGEIATTNPTRRRTG